MYGLITSLIWPAFSAVGLGGHLQIFSPQQILHRDVEEVGQLDQRACQWFPLPTLILPNGVFTQPATLAQGFPVHSPSLSKLLQSPGKFTFIGHLFLVVLLPPIQAAALCMVLSLLLFGRPFPPPVWAVRIIPPSAPDSPLPQKHPPQSPCRYSAACHRPRQ